MGIFLVRRKALFKSDLTVNGTLTATQQTYATTTVASGGAVDLALQTGVSANTKTLIKHVSGTIANIPNLIASVANAAIEYGCSGTDTDIDIQMTPKGAGKLRTPANFWKKAASDLGVYLGTTALLSFAVKYVAVAVNYVQVTPSATGNAVDVGAIGTDTDISITITPKGAGITKHAAVVQLKAYTVATVPAAAAGNVGGLIYVSDGNAGAKTLAMSDGTNWKVIALGSTIASS